MFTGLVEATGTIERLTPDATGRRLRIASPLGEALSEGDSIAVNGVCLTVTARDAGGFDAVVSPETLRVTTLGEAAVGRVANLERPLRADDRLVGHFVLGHVDGVGRLRALDQDGDCYWLEVEIPRALRPFLIPKGSIALDGISLTIAALLDDAVRVQIIPFTFAHTSLQSARVGDGVNVEADVIGKYVARLMGDRVAAGQS
jgi:riboflavin synthase